MVSKYNLGAIITAIILSVLTITIFFFARNIGPDNVIRTFHVAVENKDDDTLKKCVIQPYAPSDLNYVAQRISKFLAANGQWIREKMITENGETLVKIIYYFPDRTTVNTIWVIKKINSSWKIDIDQTAEIWQKTLGL